MNILWRGARGQTVKDLQSSLKRLGFDPGDADGIFGPSTATAVADFQRSRKLDVDGIVGPKTFSALKPSVPSQDAIKTAR
jgi:peptidoglycan hydrolase-like protein with peptidoglycan-binding domain